MSYPRKEPDFNGYKKFSGMLVYGDRVYNVPLTVIGGSSVYTIQASVTSDFIYNVSSLNAPI